MSLIMAATPIGNWGDLSLRLIEELKSCDLVIGEEKREVEILLKRAGAFPKPYELLNEHSDEKQLKELVKLTQGKRVVFVTDCGTPGFCDPGAELVQMARQSGVQIHSLPGPSSLMSFLSVCGIYMNEFYFGGFLPRENSERIKKLKSHLDRKAPTILMDTPYRLKKLLEEIKEQKPETKLVLGMDLSQENELVLSGTPEQVLSKLDRDKAEFLLLIR